MSFISTYNQNYVNLVNALPKCPTSIKDPRIQIINQRTFSTDHNQHLGSPSTDDLGVTGAVLLIEGRNSQNLDLVQQGLNKLEQSSSPRAKFLAATVYLRGDIIAPNTDKAILILKDLSTARVPQADLLLGLIYNTLGMEVETYERFSHYTHYASFNDWGNRFIGETTTKKATLLASNIFLAISEIRNYLFMLKKLPENDQNYSLRKAAETFYERGETEKFLKVLEHLPLKQRKISWLTFAAKVEYKKTQTVASEYLEEITNRNGVDSSEIEQQAEAHLILGRLAYRNKYHSDFEKAATHFQKAAVQGSEKGEYFLALAYYSGKGVKKDVRKAKELFERASKKGFKPATIQLNQLNEGKNLIPPEKLEKTVNSDSITFENPEQELEDAVVEGGSFLGKAWKWVKSFSGAEIPGTSLFSLVGVMLLVTIVVASILNPLFLLHLAIGAAIILGVILIGGVGMLALFQFGSEGHF